MPWIYLVIAGIFEVVWAYWMKRSHGFSLPWPTVITLAAMLASVWLLALAMRSLPLGTAYIIWTGIGAVGAFVVGVTLLGEPLTTGRVLAAALIIGGLVLMRLTSP